VSAKTNYNWLHFIRKSSPEGARFAEQFQQKTVNHPDLAFGAVAFFQKHQPDEGIKVLDEYKLLIREQETERELIDHVLLRWYYAALAYYYYCQDSYEEALNCLELAQRCLEIAINAHAFLVVLATDCEEFCLHKARVARNLRRWKEMKEHVAIARKMHEGTAPLCTLPGGSEVRFQDVKDFYLSIPDLKPDEVNSLRAIMDTNYRLSLFEVFVQRMYVLPGFVIVY